MKAADDKPQWGASYRLIAAEKWKAKSAAMGRAVTEALVDYARPREGMNVLDVATGTGEPGISLASQVGRQGHVTALDLSSELLEIAGQRARQRDLKNFSIQQADVHQLPFPNDSFDLVTCRFGVMFFADTDRALGEVHRVLRPAGRACFLAWGPFEQPYWSTTMAIVHRHAGGALIEPGAQDPFTFASAGSLSLSLRRAGFQEIDEKLEELPWSWPGPAEEVWEYAKSVSTPFRPLLERVREEQWPDINRQVKTAMQPYSDGKGVNFGVRVILASGEKGRR